MSRVLARAVRLLKFGAVAGALVGVGRLVIKRRRQSEVAESSWPTIAETAAAQDGQPADDDADADAPEPSTDADGADDAGGDDAGGDDAGEEAEDKS